jgi:hypothetical protein
MIRVIIAFTYSICLLCTCSVFAQPISQSQQVNTPRHLGDILPNTYWNVEEWGALLAVAPSQTFPKSKPRDSNDSFAPPIFVPLPSSPPRGYNLTNTLTLFDYNAVKTGTVTVIAPTMMRVFTRPTIPAEEAATLGKLEAGAEFFASLTKLQWELVASANGIGRSDLSEKQQKLYDAILPEKATLYPQHDPENPDSSVYIQQLSPNGILSLDKSTELTPTQIRQFRLHINNTLRLYYANATRGPESGYSSFGDIAYDANTPKPKYTLVEPPLSMEESQDPLVRKMYPKVPNSLKPSDINYKSTRLNVAISLKDIKTVEDLVTRIGQTTHLTLYADARVGKRILYLRGESARAGDLLQALCLAITGAFRKIDDNVFLLTESKDGLGTRMVAYTEWERNVTLIRNKRQMERLEAMKKNGKQIPLQDPYGLSPEVIKQMHTPSAISPANNAQNWGIETSKLPEKLQKIIQKQGKETNSAADIKEENKIRVDRVLLRDDAQAYWLLPNFGQFPSNLNSLMLLNGNYPLTVTFNYPKAPTKPFILPEAWKKKCSLIVTVKDSAEVRKIVALASTNNFTEIWLTVPPIASEARPILEEAIRVAKPYHIAIGASFNPFLVAKTPETISYLADRNIFGETSDVYALHPKMNLTEPILWGNNAQQVALASTSTNIERLQKEMGQISASPNISSVLFQSNITQGYRKDEFYWGFGNPMGFYKESRLTFLKKEGVDPIDIVLNPYMSTPPVTIPYFFPNNNMWMFPSNDSIEASNFVNKKWVEIWNAFLVPQFSHISKDFYLSLSKSFVPLYLSLSDAEWIVRWEKPDVTLPQVPFEGDMEHYGLAQARAVQKLSPTVLRRVSAWAGNVKMWSDNLANYADSDANLPFVQGVVLDLSTLPLDQVPVYLQAFQEKIIDQKK